MANLSLSVKGRGFHVAHKHDVSKKRRWLTRHEVQRVREQAFFLARARAILKFREDLGIAVKIASASLDRLMASAR